MSGMILSGQVEPSSAELLLRLRQQELVAGFGRFSLRHDDLDRILTEACSVASDGLATRLAKVLQYLPEEGAFVVRAGLGWREGVVGHARLGGDLESPAGFAFNTGQPVLSNHLGNETRFRTPRLLAEHGVHSAINVLISDSMGSHFGVLEVDSTQRDKFTQADTAFLQGLANSVADGVAKQSRIDALHRSQELGGSLLQVSPDCVQILSLDGMVEMVSPQGVALHEADRPEELAGRSWIAQWAGEAQGQATAALTEAREGRPSRFEALSPTRKGTLRWWDVTVAPMPQLGRGAPRLVAIARDITASVQAAEAKDRLLRDKDLLMQEIHHRVKNSLQMVQNLLSLQARAADDDAAADVLRESAARVHTIGAIHDRLYRGGTALEVAVRPYLEGLIEDICEAMASTLDGRDVTLESDDVVWPAAAMPALGLVTTELITNGLKYGRGTIRVSFRQPEGGQGVLEVADEGQLPPDSDPIATPGLGMRIVTGLLRPRSGGLEVLRDRPTTTLRATFPQHV